MLYVIKLNIILALLCLLFQVVMHRDTFFGVRRAMLWGIYLTAFLLPLWNVQSWLQEDSAAMNVASDYATYVLPSLEVTATRVAAMGIQQKEPGCGMWFVGVLAIWAIIYLIPVVWMTLKLLWQFAYIIYLRCTCKPIQPLNINHKLLTIYSFPRPCSPFSFGPWIFLHAEGMDEQTLREVLIHEQAHVRGWHTLDILFSQLVCILFWWNPAAWVLRREVRLNLEFIADKAVADSLSPIPMGGALKAYQYRLLGFSLQTNVATIANNFNVLPLKRRIVMMNLKRTRRTGMVKYAVFVPIAAALLFLSNIDALARSIKAKVKPLAHIEQAITAPEAIASIMEEVKPAAEEHIVEQMEVIIEEISAAQDSVVSEASNSTPNLVRLNDKALWVIDNKVSTAEEAAKLKADDIESMTVLEGDAATAVWGSRGTDGVIVIKTKNAPRDDDEKSRIYEDPEFKAEYPGGEPALYQFLALNVKYPPFAMENNVQGRVIVSFVIEKDGSISEIKANPEKKMTNQLSEIMVTAIKPEATTEQKEYAEKYAAGLEQLKAEAIRVVSAMPQWKPGRHKDEPVRVRYMLPIMFRLQ